MKKWFYIIPLLLMASCSDYVKVGGTFKHGNVPLTNFNKPENDADITNTPIEQISNPSTISFWTVYLPFLIIVLYITYKTFSSNRKSKK
tara:strand:- start:224 stop:490 length:267 start_codon:yes stop_codon:yes gene_type:complete